MYAAGVRAGETVVIFGAGGVGSNAVQGAATPARRTWSSWTRWRSSATWPRFSAPPTRSPTPQTAHEFVVETTWGELADHAIITVGVLHDEVIADALKIVGKSGQVTDHRGGQRVDDEHRPAC